MLPAGAVVMTGRGRARSSNAIDRKRLGRNFELAAAVLVLKKESCAASECRAIRAETSRTGKAPQSRLFRFEYNRLASHNDRRARQ